MWWGLKVSGVSRSIVHHCILFFLLSFHHSTMMLWFKCVCIITFRILPLNANFTKQTCANQQHRSFSAASVRRSRTDFTRIQYPISHVRLMSFREPVTSFSRRCYINELLLCEEGQKAGEAERLLHVALRLQRFIQSKSRAPLSPRIQRTSTPSITDNGPRPFLSHVCLIASDSNEPWLLISPLDEGGGWICFCVIISMKHSPACLHDSRDPELQLHI